MKPLSKRVLSAVLAACMAGSALPATAMAATLTIRDSVAGAATAASLTPTVKLSDTTIWYGEDVETALDSAISITLTNTTYTGTEYRTGSIAGVAGSLTYSYVNKATGKAVLDPVDAGTYTVTATLAGNDSYNSATATGTLTIKASVSSISASAITVTYDGSAVTESELRDSVTVTMSDGKTYSGDLTFWTQKSGDKNYENTLPTDAGTYSIKVVSPASANQDGESMSAETTLTIKKATTTIEAPTATRFTYTGNAISYSATAYLNKDDKNYEATLSSSKISYSYTGTTSDNKSVEGTGLPKDKGTYTITMKVAGTDNYSEATVTKTITISDASIEISAKNQTFSYTGKAVTLSDVKATLTDSTAADVTSKLSYSYTNNDGETVSGLPTDAGTYEIYATATGYTTEPAYVCRVTIAKATTTITMSESKTVAYTGKAVDGTATAVWNKDDENFETDCSDKINYYYRVKGATTSWNAGMPTEAGTYSIKAEVEGTDNYAAASVTGVLTVSTAVASITMPTETSFTYTGKEIEYEATAKMGDKTIDSSEILYQYKESTAADSTYKSGLPVKVGTYTIKASLASSSSYTSESKTATVTIKKAKPTITMADKTTTYNGSPIEMKATVKLLADDTNTVTTTYSYKLSGESDSSFVTVGDSNTFPVNAGTYTVRVEVKVAGDQYETTTKDATLTIKPIELQLTWETDCADGCVHDGNKHTATPSILSTAKILSADQGKIVVTAKDNTQTKAGTYTVTASFTGEAAGNYTATSDTKTYKFVISEHEHVYQTTVEPATLSEPGAEVSKCTLTDCDYIGASEEIACPAEIRLSKTTYVYSGKSKNPTVRVYDTDGARIPSANYTISYPNGRKNVGTHTVEIEFTGDRYVGTMTAEFVINPSATSILSLTSGKSYIKVSYKAVSKQISGYEIQYATKSSFSNAQSVLVSKSKTSKMIKNLSRSKKYYVRVRTYKMVDGVEYTSAWSRVKNIKTK